MLITAIHLLRRDLPARSASIRWIQTGRWLAVLSGIATLLGSLLLPSSWVLPVQGALGALWPTVLGCGLLTYARYVTYVTNEAGLERSTVRKSRWMTRVVEFAAQVQEMAQEEWQVYRARREQAKAVTPPPTESTEDVPAAPALIPVRSAARAEASQRATAPLRKLQAQAIETDETEDEESSVPVTRAANMRPRQPTPVADVDEEPAASVPAIPSPHFAVRGENPETEFRSDSESDRSISRKERKKARRA
jgi:hypothetical protein